MKYIRIHVYEYTEQMFASNLPNRDRQPKYISRYVYKEEHTVQDAGADPRSRFFCRMQRRMSISGQRGTG